MSSLSPDRQDERDNFENVFAVVVGGSKGPKNSPKSTPWIWKFLYVDQRYRTYFLINGLYSLESTGMVSIPWDRKQNIPWIQ